jgi:soluble lytic murein transglycosylase-like protein
MKAVEVQAAKEEQLLPPGADPARRAELDARRARLRAMESEYDAFVREIGGHRKLAPDERVILRVARAFGECEVNVPDAFVAEVRRYVSRWRSSDRLARALAKAQQRAYPPRIVQALAERDLAPQFFYLAAQESGFDERAVGPATRYGYAKGMWQFIPATARRYGLRVGPLHEQAAYDPQDERFDWEKATVAAARYLRELLSTDAQASGLLAMACYNWGESNVRGIVTSLPESPEQRNFWRLLADRSVPRETYDYVLSIFSAAVICEDPRLFGFELECPALGPAAR